VLAHYHLEGKEAVANSRKRRRRRMKVKKKAKIRLLQMLFIQPFLQPSPCTNTQVIQNIIPVRKRGGERKPDPETPKKGSPLQILTSADGHR
jgi:hypothetical protein